MPLVVGVDEAGYGPIWGRSSCRRSHFKFPPPMPNSTSCWPPAVSRVGGGGAFLVDDSKAVHAGADPLGRLEAHVLPWLWPVIRGAPTLGQLVGVLGSCWATELDREPWYDPAESLPVGTSADTPARAELLAAACRAADVALAAVVAVVVTPAQFNAILDAEDNKSAVSRVALVALLAGIAPDPDAPPAVRIDKQGGRNFYGLLLQDAWPDVWIDAVVESAARSAYRGLRGGEPAVAAEFRPRAESAYPDVALASMVSKYLRELLMRQFNRYWQTRVPGLAGTAGYPVDAARFYAAIHPLLAGAGVGEADVWRRK